MENYKFWEREVFKIDNFDCIILTNMMFLLLWFFDPFDLTYFIFLSSNPDAEAPPGAPELPKEDSEVSESSEFSD